MKRSHLVLTIPFALLAFLAGCSSSNGDGSSSSADGGGTHPAGDDASIASDGSTYVPPTGSDSGLNSSDGGVTPATDASFDAGLFDAAAGHVLAQFPLEDDAGDTKWGRVSPVADAAIDYLAPQNAGDDQYANLTRDGQLVALVTEALGCQGGDCLAVANADGSNGALVTPGGASEIDVYGRPAILSGGDLIVFPMDSTPDGGATPHAADLYAVKKTGSTWGTPILLTAAMTEANAHDIAISYDGTKVVFDCGPTDYQGPGTDICEANTDGSGMSILIAHTAGPGATNTNATHHPDFAPDGTIVFEADWSGGEQIWRFTAPSTFAQVAPTVNDDNSPCVLPDGRIASLWLERAGNTTGLHELKVMGADGSNPVMVVINEDIEDIGQSCSQ